MYTENEINGVVRLSRVDKPEAVEVLALAFHEYPVMRYTLKDAGGAYEEHLRAMIGFFVESRLMRDWPLLGVRKEGKLVAVAAVNSPDKKPRPPELQELYLSFVELIGPMARERVETFERVSGNLVPQQPLYYLGMTGVVPELQGKGLVRPLLDRVHALSEEDPTSTGVCLSTELPANVPLYQHFGYRIAGEADAGEIHTWCMFRENGG